MKRAISNIFNNALNHNETYTSLKIESYLKENNVILKIFEKMHENYHENRLKLLFYHYYLNLY